VDTGHNITTPQEAMERCRLTEGRAEALLLHLLYAFNFRKGAVER
jgi:hypothetical protein